MYWVLRFINKWFLFFVACLLLVSVLGAALIRPESTSALDTISPWLVSDSPTLKNLEEKVPADQLPISVSGSQECLIPQKFVTKPAKAPGILLPFGQSETSYLSCSIDAPFGTIDNQQNLTRTGTHTSGPVYSAQGNKIKLYAIPNSNTAMTLDNNAPTGVYITLQRDIGQRLSTEINKSTGDIKHKLTDGSSQLIKDELSKPLDTKIDAKGISGNGKWVVFDAPSIGLVRLDVETGAIMIFAPGYRYDDGLSPSLQMAVTSNGRYAAVMSSTYGIFKIYDLETCVKAISPNKPATCQNRDLKKVLQTIMPEHTGLASIISFTDDYTLKFYGSTLKAGVRTFYEQLLTAYGQTPAEFSYLALGDSFASGEGAGSYEPGTDVKSPLNKCHLSTNSYPYLLGKQLDFNSYKSVACSGAKIKDINGQGVKENNYNQNGKQSHGKESSLYDAEIYENFLTGYRIQDGFVAKYQPSKITVSVSGNDVGFGNVVRNCVFWADDCYSQPFERAVLVKTINDRFDELVKMYGQLKVSSSASKIYAIGYPKLVNPDGNCAVNVRASRDELKFFDGLVPYINFVIKKAADKAGIYYVDVSDALDGHRLCETNELETAVNGLTAGDDKVFDLGPIGNESYHPNSLGQDLLASTIMDKTGSFTAENPYPDKSVQNPTLADARSLIETSVYDLMDTNYFDKEDMIDSWWYKNQSQLLSAEGFAPNSTVAATLTSDPLALGSFSANNEGFVNTNLVLPGSVPAGYHTLHLSGQNLAGENIEYQQQVFVASSENDYYGDGIVNDKDSCLAIDPAGVDYDKDGVDDVCDGQIGEPPIIQPPIDNPDAALPLPDTTPQPENQSDISIISPVDDSQNQNGSGDPSVDNTPTDVSPVVTPLPGFESQPAKTDGSSPDIIKPVNNNQGTTSSSTSANQAQGGSGVQQGLPTQSPGANVQQTPSLNFGSAGGTAPLLNQNSSGNVLSIATPSRDISSLTTSVPNIPKESSGLPLLGIFGFVVVFIAAGLLLKKQLAKARY